MTGSVTDDSISFHDVNRSVEQLSAAITLNKLEEKKYGLKRARKDELKATKKLMRFFKKYYLKNEGVDDETVSRSQRRKSLLDDYKDAKRAVAVAKQSKDESKIPDVKELIGRCTRTIASFMAEKDTKSATLPNRKSKPVIPEVILSSSCGLKTAKMIEKQVDAKGHWFKGRTIDTIKEKNKFDEIADMLGLTVEEILVDKASGTSSGMIADQQLKVKRRRDSGSSN